MDPRAPGSSEQAIEDAETYCYGHPNTPTKLRCSRCDRPICGRCAIPASVGQHCPECVAEARRSAPKVRTAIAATAPAVLGIIVITGIFFILQQMGVGNLTGRFPSCPAAIQNGEWWRLLTPVLVHANAIHVLMNMFVLYIYGMNCEEAFGSVRLVIIYVGSALLGSALSYATHKGVPSVGASGAVFGVVGALIVYLYRRRSSQFIRQHLSGMMMFLALNAVLGFLLPNVDVMAHFGGLIGGMIIGASFDRRHIGAQAMSPALLQIAGVVAVLSLSIGLVAWKSSTSFFAFC
ncbi:MAG: rhomboid family intramembrane serine protease [Actinomycetota bacterium]|nr:rhomboid family intramembrane serine protease [Actinomycetota bacterium]